MLIHTVIKMSSRTSTQNNNNTIQLPLPLPLPLLEYANNLIITRNTEFYKNLAEFKQLCVEHEARNPHYNYSSYFIEIINSFIKDFNDKNDLIVKDINIYREQMQECYNFITSISNYSNNNDTYNVNGMRTFINNIIKNILIKYTILDNNLIIIQKQMNNIIQIKQLLDNLKSNIKTIKNEYNLYYTKLDNIKLYIDIVNNHNNKLIPIHIINKYINKIKYIYDLFIKDNYICKQQIEILEEFINSKKHNSSNIYDIDSISIASKNCDIITDIIQATHKTLNNTLDVIQKEYNEDTELLYYIQYPYSDIENKTNLHNIIC